MTCKQWRSMITTTTFAYPDANEHQAHALQCPDCLFWLYLQYSGIVADPMSAEWRLKDDHRMVEANSEDGSCGEESQPEGSWRTRPPMV